MTSTKLKAFGAKKSASPFKKSSNIDDLVSSLGHGLQQSKQPINVQYIPIENIIFDQKNPRNLSLTIEEIKSGPKLGLSNGQSDLAEFESQVMKYFENNSVKVKEYLELSDLALSIQIPDNLINPITVRADQLSFHLIAGHRRTFAHIILGQNEISANIMNISPGLDHSVLQWKENKDRSDLTFVEQINNLVLLYDEYKKKYNAPLSAQILFELLGLKKAWAGRYLTIINEYKDNSMFKKTVDQGAITSIDAGALIAKASVEVKEKILNALLHGHRYSLAELKKLIVELKPSPKIQSKSLRTPIKNKEDVSVYKKIINVLLQSPNFNVLSEKLDGLNFDRKKDLQAGWEEIIKFVKNQ